MERRIERLDDRLRALAGALRLRGEAPEEVAEVEPAPPESGADRVHRLRRLAAAGALD